MGQRRIGSWTTLLLLVALVHAPACEEDGAGNHPPVFETIYHQVFRVGESGNRVIVTATDKDGDALAYSLRGKLWPRTDREEAFVWGREGDSLPAGMTFSPEPTKAVFTWDPLASQVGTHEVTFIVRDAYGGDEENISVEVRPSEEGGGGAPEFVTPSSYVLQLVQTHTIDSVIAVRDDDSARVDLSLQGAPEGLDFKVLGADGKRAQFSWTPSEQQIGAQSIYGFLAVAVDPEGNRAEQRVRIVIRLKDGGGPRPDCPGEVPSVEHQPLRNQYGAQDYVITAGVADEGTIARVFAAYTTNDPQDLQSFEAAEFELVEAPDGGHNYRGVIPNRTQPGAEPVTYYYYVCALDDDDPDGEDCDHFWCVPEEAIFTFVAHPEEGGAGDCADDAREPNDSQQAPWAMEPGSLPDLWLCPGDEDWFGVQASAGSTIEASILFATALGDLALEVLSPDGQVLQRSATSSDREEVQAVAPTDGLHLLRITGALAAGSEGNGYSLSVRLEAGGECAPDAGEPNDDLGRASAVEPGQSGPYTICAGDEDFYALQVEPGSEVVVQVRFEHRLGDLDARMLAADGTVLTSSATDGDVETLRHVVAAGDRVYLQVLGVRASNSSYSIDVSVQGLGECPDLAQEPNDTPEQAPWIEDDSLQGAICPTGAQADVDVFRIFLPAFTGVGLSARFSHAAGDLDMLLSDPQERVLAIADSSDDDEHIEFPGLPEDSTVYVHMEGYQGAQNTYTLDVEQSPFTERCRPDRGEPNDTAEQAARVRPQEGSAELPGLSLCAGDEDWFLIEVAEGGSILVGIDFAHARGDLSLSLLDGDAVIDTGETQADTETVAADDLAAGAYRVRVFSVDGRPNLYRLDVLAD